MTRHQVSLPTRQQPLSDRVYLAAGADPAWRSSDDAWQEWLAWLPRPPTTEIYLMLRSTKSFRSLQELAHLHQTTYRTLGTILHELARLRLIKLERERGTIMRITVNDPPPVPDNLDSTLRLFVYNRPPVRRAEVDAFIQYWCSRYKQHRKHDYHVRRGKDRVLVRDRIASYGLDELKRLAWFLLHKGVGDDVIPYKEVSLGTFAGRLDRIAEEKKADEQPSARID